MLALPLAALFTALAWALTSLLGGAQYLPDGAIATQLMIWSIPVGWVNSFLQYALIALDLQRRITRAFLLAVGFNVAANLLLVPTYGYRAAALTTIASEVFLLLPFVWLLQRALGPLPWRDILWRPTLATALLLLILAGLWPLSAALALLIGCVLYGLAAVAPATFFGSRTPAVAAPVAAAAAQPVPAGSQVLTPSLREGESFFWRRSRLRTKGLAKTGNFRTSPSRVRVM